MDQQAANILYSKWKQIVLEANNSSIPKRQWCRQNGISEKAFYYWQHKIRRQALENMGSSNNALAPATPAGSCFVEIPFLSAENRTGTAPDPENGQPELMLQGKRQMTGVVSHLWAGF